MRFVASAGALAVIAASWGTAAAALTLAQAATPAERPPSGYSKDVYVDSRGCVYVRASIGSTVNWVPRLSRDRQTVVCGMTPTGAVASVASAPPPPPAPLPPAPLPAATTTAAAAPLPAASAMAPTFAAPVHTAAATVPAAATGAVPVTRTMEVSCPTDGATARVRIGGDTIRLTCPAGMTRKASYIVTHANGSRSRLVARPAPAGAPVRLADAAASSGQVVSDGRVVIGGRAPGEPNTAFGNGYGITHTAPPMDPVPHATWSMPSATVPSGGSVPAGSGTLPPFGNGYGLAPVEGAGRVYVPTGYRSAWDDDRLNPHRGPRTAYGNAQMATVLDTTKVPMTAAQTAVTTPAVRTTAGYVQVGAFGQPGNAENALARIRGLGLGGATARTGSGLTLVMAGPFASTADLQRALSTLRGYYPDAYVRG